MEKGIRWVERWWEDKVDGRILWVGGEGLLKNELWRDREGG